MAAIGIGLHVDGSLNGGETLAYAISSMDSLGLSALVCFAQAYLIRGLLHSIDARGRFASELNARHTELVREAALEGLDDEMPHSLAVVVEEMLARAGRPEISPMLDVRVNVFVERSSQKAIIIGKGGSRLREVGTTARKGIEALLGQREFHARSAGVQKQMQPDAKSGQVAPRRLTARGPQHGYFHGPPPGRGLTVRTLLSFQGT